MARSICFMAYLVLAMMLFAAYEVQAQHTCKSESRTFNRVCITKVPCLQACTNEGFEDGRCTDFTRKCMCYKTCVFENISNEVETNLVKEAKTLKEALLEEEIIME